MISKHFPVYHCAPLLLFLLGFSLGGQCSEQSPVVKPVTAAEIQQKEQVVKDRKNLPDDAKKRILAAYDESLDNLNELHVQEAQADAFKKSMISLPLEAKQVARQIAETENSLKNRKQEKFAIFPTDELEQRLVSEKTAMSDLDAEIARMESQINDELNRPQIIREKMAEIKNKQAASLDAQQDMVTSGSIDNLAEKEAKQILLDTRIRLLNSTLKALDLENISDPLRLQNNKDRVHLLNLQRELHSMTVADLDNFLLDRRQQEIDREQAELLHAEKAAEGKHPVILAATKENMQYNRRLREINKSVEQYLAQKNEFDLRYKQVEKDFQSAEQKINLAGLSPALGNLLREQRRNLPRRKHYTALNDTIQNEIARTSLEIYRLDDAKKNLADVGQALMQRMADQFPPDANENEKLKIRTELRMLLSDQKELVARLSTEYAEYARVLGDVDFSLQQMLSSAEKFGAFLDQRLLWVPSAPVIDKYYLDDILKSLVWFVNPANWQQMATSLWHGTQTYPLPMLVGLLIVVLHWRFKGPIKNRLMNLLSKRAGSKQHLYSFGQTMQSLLYIFVLSLTGSLLMVWLGGILLFNSNAESFSHAFAVGLFRAAVSLGVIEFFFRLFKPAGVAEALFQWRPANTLLLFNQFKWARFVFVPGVFVVEMTGSDAYSEASLSLGRAALIVMMLAMTYLLHRLAHPVEGLAKRFYQLNPGRIASLRYVWYGIALLLPLVIVGFAVDGYYQSALELHEKLIFTLRLIFVAVLFHELAQRWLAVTKQKLALQNAKQILKQEVQTTIATQDTVPPIEEPRLDISKINRQSDKLLTTFTAVIILVGCWMIWRDILSAFLILDNFVLWEHVLVVDGKERLQPITPINLIVGLTYTALTFIVVTNFPVLVDLISVGKYEMSPGSRYALIQLARYVIVSISFLAIANELGGSWSQVQWLVAALSVGLGFGLQEIFANMVSGIILLFERPIRVGDTVTVGDVTGRVGRIQMRATHIVDYDRKELIVPNKMFITDQLINWTLSDTVTRIVVPIGVAYGSSIGEVDRILREAIRKTPLVLQDPEPNVIFDCFGDSSLNFNVIVFVHELAVRLTVKNDLQKNIYEALETGGIEIPFPQRDLHIRSVADGILAEVK